jgi:two-component system response regulator AtoC
MERVLIVDDDEAIVESLKFAFKNQYKVYLAYNSKEALEHYTNNEISVTILDLKLGNEDGMELYTKIKKINPEAVVIIVTSYGTIKSSIEAIRSGVFHYLTKPIDIKELEFLIAKGTEVNNLYKQINFLSAESREKYVKDGIIGESNAIKSILNTIEKIKDIDSKVLITGESGTGKSLIAKAIHRQGNRRHKKFYAINCAAIPKNLLESELFGYKKGAFTGAATDKKGYFELAHEGTLFLDEIGDIEFGLQGKLLQAIQENVITPVGSEDPIVVDVRIITATNKDLLNLVKEEKFREDLYYRLNVINIHMPALRDRPEDIVPLANYFIYKYSRLLNKEIRKVEYDFIETLEKYELNGNVRELENLVERAIALVEGDTLTKKDILSHINKDEKSEKFINKKLIPIFVGQTLENIEKKVIETTYIECNYNQKETAKILGITDRTIRNKLKRYIEEKSKSE